VTKNIITRYNIQIFETRTKSLMRITFILLIYNPIYVSDKCDVLSESTIYSPVDLVT